MTAEVLTKQAGYSPMNAYILASIAQKSYEGREEFVDHAESCGLNTTEFFTDQETDAQAYVTIASGDIVISFRGTEVDAPQDIQTDLDFHRVDVELGAGASKVKGQVHHGFYKSFMTLWPDITKYIAEHKNGQRIWVTGHSLGAALATLAVADAAAHNMDIYAAYTIGSPHVGDEQFADAYDSTYRDRTFRIVNNNDSVPRLLSLAGYRHVGIEQRITFRGGLINDPSCWQSSSDRMLGCFSCCFWGNPNDGVPIYDGINDHGAEGYVKFLQALAGVMPTATAIADSSSATSPYATI